MSAKRSKLLRSNITRVVFQKNKYFRRFSAQSGGKTNAPIFSE
jgi:hypothetical protein